MKIITNLREFFHIIMSNQQGGLFGGDDFVLPDQKIQAGIKNLNQVANREITGASQHGQIALDELDSRRGKALQGAAAAGNASTATQLSNLGIFGGAGGGAGERIARSTSNRQQTADQQLRSDFSGQRAGLLAGDLQNQQQEKIDARNQSLQAELGLLGARTSAELGNRGAKAQRGKLFASIGATAGSALGPLGTIGGGLLGNALGGAL
jgi:hypothetical protein